MRYKVSILLLLCLWLFALPANAQRIVTIVGGTVTANVADNADFLVNLNQNVTGVTLVATTGSAATPVTPATGYVISMKFVQDATGSRTVAFGGNITTSCAINGTANAVTICRWQYTATGNTWNDIIPGPTSSNVAVTCAASTNFPVATTFITDFFVNLNCNVTSSTITGTLTTGQEAVFTLTQDATGGRTFAWPTGFLNTPPLNTVANGSTVASFQYCGTTGNGNACPANSWQNTDVGPAGVNGTSNTINLLNAKYNFPGFGQYIHDATFTNGSNIVTSTATDPPFVGNTVHPCTVGDIMWGTNAQYGFQGTQAPVVRIAVGTITSCDSATQVHVSNNANANCTPSLSDGCSFYWGPDATASVQSAFNDAMNICGTGGTLQLPAGPIIIQLAVNGTTACQPTTSTNDIQEYLQVQGYGPNVTMLMYSPAFTGTGSPLGNAQMFSRAIPNSGAANARTILHDFGSTSGFSAASTITAPTYKLYFHSHAYNLNFIAFYPFNSTGVPALSIGCNGGDICEVNNIIAENSSSLSIGSTGTVTYIHDTNWQGCTVVCWSMSGVGPIYTHDNYLNFCGTNGCVVDGGGAALNWYSSADIFSQNGGSTLAALRFQGGASEAIILRDTTISCTTTTAPCVLNSGSGSVTFDGVNNSVSALAGNANAITNSGSGTVTLKNTKLVGFGTGVSLNNSGTTTNKEGNSFAQGITNTGTINGQRGNGVEQGACTGVVTSATTVGLFNLGENSATTCTVATVGLGQVMSKAGTVYAVYCTATAGNQAADACTVVKNGAAQTMTCSLNAVSSCTDGTVAHQVAFVQGDILAVEAIAGTGTTLAAVKGTLVTN